MMFGRKHRVTSIDRVIEEIRQNGLQARHIFFCDDNFTADRQRTKELCERIIAEGLKIEWSAQVRVESAKDPELLELMAKSGCFVVFVGLESINPATLKAYNKSQTVQGIKDCVTNFHHFGIKVHGMFVFGSEEDHYQVIRDTVRFSRQLDLDSLQYLMLTPLPGTPFYKEMEAQNRIICRDWSQYDGHHTVFQPRQFTPFELQMETTRAMKKFYSWTSVIKRLIARDLFFAKMKAYGRILLWQANLKRNNYFLQLQEQLYARGNQLRQWLPQKGRLPRVGIPGDVWNLCTWEKGPRDFLIKFLERLGVEVVQETSQEKAGSGPLANAAGGPGRNRPVAGTVGRSSCCPCGRAWGKPPRRSKTCTRISPRRPWPGCSPWNSAGNPSIMPAWNWACALTSAWGASAASISRPWPRWARRFEPRQVRGPGDHFVRVLPSNPSPALMVEGFFMGKGQGSPTGFRPASTLNFPTPLPKRSWRSADHIFNYLSWLKSFGLPPGTGDPMESILARTQLSAVTSSGYPG